MIFPEYIYEWVGTAWIRELIEERVKAKASLVNTFIDRQGKMQISLVLIGGAHPVFVHSSCVPADKEFAISFLYEQAMLAVNSKTVAESKPGTAVLFKGSYRLQGQPAATRFWHLSGNEVHARNFNSFVLLELCGTNTDYWASGTGSYPQIEI